MKNFSASLSQLFKFRYFKNNPFLITTFILLIIGIYFVFNATVVTSLELYNNPYIFAIKHLSWVLMGILFFNLAFYFKIYNLRRITFSIYFVSLFFLLTLGVAKFFPCSNTGFTPCVKGAIRWIVLNPAPLPEIPFIGQISFQPSELAKLALVLVCAYFFTKETLNFEAKIKKILLYCSPIIILVFFQPNKSTAGIMVSILVAMYLIYGERLKKLLYLLPIIAGIFIFFILFNSYSLNRVKTFLEVNSSDDQNYHQNQIEISLGSGGVFGIGLGKSRQKFSFLPEIYSDSIFAVIGEEAGMLGTYLVTFLIFYLVYLGLKIASLQTDMYNKLLAVGISAWFGFQAVVNLASMAQLMPLTGVPLPLISYGGSSTIFLMTGLGILGNISKSIYERKHY